LGQEEKGMTEDEMAGWHHWLDGHESGWTPGVGDGQGGLACCSSWGHKELDTTEQLNWTELNPFPSPGNLIKEYNQSDFSIDHLVMSMCRVVSCVVGRGCLLWPVHSLGKTLLAFTLLHFVLQGQICLLLQVSLDILLLHLSPLWWKGHLF